MSATESDSDVEENADPDDRRDEDGESTEPVLSELPPSAKLVYKVLEYEGPLTQDRIAVESRLCARTVRYALGKLEEQEIVTSRVCLEDARQSTYRIVD